ncbi:FtsX-like permease family protein [Sphingomonas sp. S-NIH.Pt15_0812]|uniref:FtsX-like permease family protein n=1 Tax=Sphingomonas sp. S-NIH.Pt15_0812 TaxID=1920129 RepID=UPI000F7E3E58|nr:FtsX-like permease family protein [Sphingomonas sp. S-NIH.Pt15_0812]RSU51138.1 ABC transporter permease [Sphingomonas sp. S-NIH.Pt15_0812]
MAEAGLFRSRLALAWLVLGEWRSHPGRFAATALAIAVGVALGFAVHLVNGSALASFEAAVTGLNGAADLQVSARTPLGFDERLYPRVATAPGVADASPVISLPARAGNGRFTLLGVDVIRAGAVTPSLVGARPAGPDARSDDIFAEDGLYLSRAALAAVGASVGDRVAVKANGRTARLRVAGTLPGAPAGQALGTIDIAAAQWRFGRLGRIDRLDLKLGDRAVAERALLDLLGADATIRSGESQARQGDALSRAYRVNLDMLALVALLTGGFLVFSAQTLSVTRRLRAFALVRTLGLPRAGIVAAVALEGAIIGIVGAALGLAAGYAMAVAALRLLGGDLGGGYFGGGAAHIVFQPVAAATFFALGVAAALLGSVLPARSAARAAPAAALKNAGDILDPRAPVPWRPALVLLIAGGGAALLPAIGGLPLFGFASMALLLAGGIAGVPWLVRWLLGPWRGRDIASVPRLLAIRHVQGAPGQAAIALCGIVASTALMIAMATMVTSFRGAVDDWLGQVLSADLYLRADSGDLDSATQRRIAAVAGIRGAAFSRQLPLTIVADRPPVTLIVRPVRGDVADPLLVLLEQAKVPAGATPIWASEPAARLYGWSPGRSVMLPVGGRSTRFVVAGVWRDYARQQGAVVIRDVDYVRLTGDRGRDEAAITLAPGADPATVRRAVAAMLPPGISVAEPATLRRFALQLFDRSFAITYGLEAVAILVGLAGVAATMSAQTIARSKEFGMLRHLGLTRRQVTAMLASEGALLGLIGAVAGVALGALLGQVLIHVVNPQSFNWTMTTIWPFATIAGVTAALTVAAAVTAMLAGRRATAADAVAAVREDW